MVVAFKVVVLGGERVVGRGISVLVVTVGVLGVVVGRCVFHLAV